MTLVIDLIIITIFTVVVIRAAKQGFVSTILSAVVWIFTLFIAGELCTVVADGIYYSFVNERIIEIVAARMPDFSQASMAVDYAKGIVENIPDFFVNFAEKAGIDTNNLVLSFSGVNLETADIAKELTERIAAPIVISILKAISFIILGIVIYAILKIAVRLIDKFFKINIPLVKKTNQLLGAAVGVIKGIFIVGVLCILLYIISSFGTDNWLTQSCEKSHIITWFSSSNIMISIFGI